MSRAPQFIANFDSTSAMLRALGRFLDGRDSPRGGVIPRIAGPLFRLVNHLPRRAWDSPEPDAERPEAEWGYEETLTEESGSGRATARFSTW